MKKILMIVSILLATQIALAENAIGGRVIDENSQPLKGVKVLIKSTDIQAVTDLAGEYIILNPPFDDQTLQFFLPGYRVEERKVFVEKSHDPKVFIFRVITNPVKMKPIEIEEQDISQPTAQQQAVNAYYVTVKDSSKFVFPNHPNYYAVNPQTKQLIYRTVFRVEDAPLDFYDGMEVIYTIPFGSGTRNEKRTLRYDLKGQYTEYTGFGMQIRIWYDNRKTASASPQPLEKQIAPGVTKIAVSKASSIKTTSQKANDAIKQRAQLTKEVEESIGVAPMFIFGWLDEPREERIIKALVRASERSGLPVEFLTAAAFQEGLNDFIEANYYTDPNSELYAGEILGLLTFGYDIDKLKDRGFLRKSFNEYTIVITGDYSKGYKVSIPQFKNVDYALEAFGAVLAARRAGFLGDAKSLGYDAEMLTEEQINYWTYVYFNCGNSCGLNRIKKSIEIPQEIGTPGKAVVHPELGRTIYIPSNDPNWNAKRVLATTELIKRAGLFSDYIASCPLDAGFLEDSEFASIYPLGDEATPSTGSLIAGEQGITQQAVSIDQISAFLSDKAAGTKLEGTAQILYDKGVQYGIDPRFALAVALKESAGTSKLAVQCNNLFGIRKSTNACPVGKNWQSYDSVESSIDAFYRLIKNKYVAKGRDSVEAVANAGYCGNRARWIRSVKALMSQMNTQLCGTTPKAGKPVASASTCQPVCKDDFILVTAQGERDCWDEDSYCDKRINLCTKFHGSLYNCVHNLKSITESNKFLCITEINKFINDKYSSFPEDAKETILKQIIILLKREIEEDSWEIRERVITTLVRIQRDEVFDILFEAIQKEQPLALQDEIIRSLATIESPKSIEILKNIVNLPTKSNKKSDIRLQQNSIESIGAMADALWGSKYSPESLSALFSILDSNEEPEIRVKALEEIRTLIRKISERGELNKFDIPYDVLIKRLKTDTSSSVREGSANILGYVLITKGSDAITKDNKDPKILALIDALKTDPSPDVKYESGMALGKFDWTSGRIRNYLYDEIPNIIPLLESPKIKQKAGAGEVLVRYLDHPEITKRPYYIALNIPQLEPPNLFYLMYNNDALFKRIRNKLTSNPSKYPYDTTKLNSISMTVYRYFIEEAKNSNPSNDAIEFRMAYAIAKRNVFENEIILDSNTYFITFAHSDILMQNKPVEDFAARRGVKKFAMSFKGPSAKELIKDRIIKSKTEKNTVIWVNVHGLPKYICLGGGVPHQSSVDENECDGFRYDEFANILLERGKDNIQEVTLIIDSCFSWDFADYLRKDLKEKGSKKFPIIITETNKGKFGTLGIFLGSLKSLENDGSLKDKKPLLGKHIYEAEKYSMSSQDSSVFFDENGGYPEEIALNNLNHEYCTPCEGESCPIA